MTKADLIAVIEKQANLTPKQSEKVVNICFDSMIQSLYDDERIEIRGFGSFANRNYKAYEGRNPKTGKVVIVEPKKVPFFKVGKELKEMVDDLLSFDSLNKRNIYNVDLILTKIDLDRKGKEDNAHLIWQILTNEIWFNTFTKT